MNANNPHDFEADRRARLRLQAELFIDEYRAILRKLGWFARLDQTSPDERGSHRKDLPEA